MTKPIQQLIDALKETIEVQKATIAALQSCLDAERSKNFVIQNPAPPTLPAPNPFPTNPFFPSPSPYGGISGYINTDTVTVQWPSCVGTVKWPSSGKVYGSYL